MKVQGLDGRTHQWNLGNHEPLGSDDRPRSKYHLKARELLTELFPADRRLEELPLPGSGGLFADFYLPARRLLVEVQGQQHFQMVSFFHKTHLDFVKGRVHDLKKREWCETNDIHLVELPFDESLEQWRERILGSATEATDGPGADDSAG